MAAKKLYFDQAIGESAGNGGDLQLLGNDLALVYGMENQVYLALFGGNVEGNWWGNSLLMPNDTAKQFNSNTERTLNTVALNSSGIAKIQAAVESDLKYLKAKVTVIVSLFDTNTVGLNIKVAYNSGGSSLTIINFGKKVGSTGDFSLLDFSQEDFF